MRSLTRKFTQGATVVYLSFIFLAVHAEKDYCNPSLCNGKKHIACLMKPGQYAPNCEVDANVIELTNELEIHILQAMNFVRDKVALRNKATKMSTLVWDTELAFIAEMYVRQCELTSSTCQNTEKWKNVGQTLAYRGVRGVETDVKDVTYHQIIMWFNEEENIKDVIYISNLTNQWIAPNFYQLVYDNAQYVGCAALQQSKSGWLQTYLVCNFDNKPVLGQPVYVEGASPGKDCKGGMNPKFKNLCRNPNDSVTNGTDTVKNEVKESNAKKPEKSTLENQKLRFQRFLDKIESATKQAAKYKIKIRTSNHIVNVNKIQDNNVKGTQSS